MAAISLSIVFGTPELQPGSYTAGVLAPGAGDFEFRWNQTASVSGNPITRKEAIRVLYAIAAQLESSTFTVTTPEAFP